MSTNTQKFVLLVLALVALVGLMGTATIGTDAGMPLISAVVFYGIGNGIATRQGVTAQPVFAPKPVPVVMVPARSEERINELTGRLGSLSPAEADELRLLIQGDSADN